MRDAATGEIGDSAAGMRVLEIGDRLSGAFTGLMLTALGASVCQRRSGRRRRVDALESAYFDRGRLVLTDEAVDVPEMMRHADVVVTDLVPAQLAELGIPVSEAGLDRIRPGLVHVAFTPFGLDGQAHLQAEGITEWAAGGIAYSTRRAVPDDDDDGYVPVVAPGRQPEMLAGLSGAIGALVGLREARRSGRSVVVDVSRQEVQAALLHSLFPQLVSNTVVAGDPSHRIVYGMLVAASDGPVYFRPLELHQWHGLVEWMESPDWAVAITAGLPAEIPSFDVFAQLMGEWAARFTREQLLQEGQRRRVPVALPSDLGELLVSEQLAARRFWRPLDLTPDVAPANRPPEGGDTNRPPEGGDANRPPTAMAPSLPLLEPERWPPSRRVDWADVVEAWQQGGTGGPGDGPLRPPRAKGPRAATDPGPAPVPGPIDPAAAPLEGVRVLDLGRSWSAPFAAMVLGDLGAEVIKVESTTRIDVLRFSSAFVDGVRDPERSGYNLACNRGKLSLTLDLKRREGRDLLLRLVEVSDVLLENFSVDVMRRLGLGADVLLARNPDLVMASLSGYGATGPDRSFISYGDHLLHASGFTALTGQPGDIPTKLSTFYGDPVGGLYAAVGVVAALAGVERGRGGRWLDLSQLEGLISMLPREAITAATGGAPYRSADKSPTMCPHGFYRCAGDDTWVAIAVSDDTGWARLRAELELAGMEVPELGDFATRKAAEPVVDAAIGAFAASRSPWEVSSACQRVGVAAYPVLSTARMIWDDHLAARQFFSWVHRPISGPGPMAGPVLRMGTSGSRVRGYAPLLGEHNRIVMEQVVGLDVEEFDRLSAQGVFR